MMKDGNTKVYSYKIRQCNVYSIWDDLIKDGWL
jgi:hypothetical protein